LPIFAQGGAANVSHGTQANRPATCKSSRGEVYWQTDGASGFYVCPDDHWTLISSDLFSQGLASARPTASASNKSHYYFATDTNGGTLYASTGSAWVQLGLGLTEAIPESRVTGLISDLAGKAASVHTHTLSQIVDAGTAAALNAPASGNAASGEVVKGSDTRLSDARTPTSHAATHGSAGSDPVTISESQVTNLSTDLNSESSARAAADASNLAAINAHIADRSNPHGVTKAQVGLPLADNTSDANKPVSTAQQAALDLKQPLDPTLTSLAAFNANGCLAQTAADAFAARTLAAGSTKIVITNGNCIAGNPVIDLGTLLVADIPTLTHTKISDFDSSVSALITNAAVLSALGFTPENSATSHVNTFNTRSGAVVAAANDYNFNQLAGSVATSQQPSTTVNSIVNDTNIQGSISAQALTLSFSGSLSKARQHAATVYNDQTNVFAEVLQTFRRNAIATTLTDAVQLSNTTASTSGVPVQQSPSLRFTAHVWNTTATAADNSFDLRTTLIPTSGATPTARVSWQFSNNGGAFAEKGSLDSSGNLSLSGQLLLPDGSPSAPPFSFSAHSNYGIYYGSSGVRVAVGGFLYHEFLAGTYKLDDAAATISLNGDVLLTRDGAANTLALRNGTNAQTQRWYASYTDASNYTRASLAVTTSAVTLAAESAGTGSANVGLAFTSIGTSPINFTRAGTATNPALILNGDTTTGWYQRAATAWTFSVSGTGLAEIHPAGFRVASNKQYLFSSGAIGASDDAALARAAAKVVEINDGTAGHAGTLLLRGQTFASLPASPVAGMHATVTDSTTTTYGASIAGSGSNTVHAFYNGTNWVVD
jgi:hypothetical protein